MFIFELYFNFFKMKLLLKLWTFWCLLITVSIFFILLIPNLFLIFCLGDFGRNIFVQYNYYVGNILLFLFGMRKITSGSFPIKYSKPCVYVVNHKSYLDVIIIASLIPYKIKYLGKAEVFKWPLFGYLAKHSGQIAVKREDKASRQQGFDSMKRALNDGYSIILFPEGGWRNNGDVKSKNPYNLQESKLLQEFRNGAFRLALETKVPVIPIALMNAQERFSDVTMLIKPGNVFVHIFEPIDSRSFHDAFDLNHKCHNLILNKLKEFNL